MLMEITDNNFDEKVMNSSFPFVILFSSPWCGVCKRVLPRMDSISGKYDRLNFGKIDITENPQKPSEFNVRSIPTIIIFKGNEEKDRIIGDVSEDKLGKKIEIIL